MKSRFTVILSVLLPYLSGFNAGYLLGQSPAAPFRAFPTSASIVRNKRSLYAILGSL